MAIKILRGSESREFGIRKRRILYGKKISKKVRREMTKARKHIKNGKKQPD